MKELVAAGGTHEPLTIPSVVDVYLVTTETLEPPPDAELIVNETEGEVCPPLETVTEAVPAEAIRLALTEVVN